MPEWLSLWTRVRKKAKYFYYILTTIAVKWRRERINILANLRCSMRIYPVIQKTINQLCGFSVESLIQLKKKWYKSLQKCFIKRPSLLNQLQQPKFMIFCGLFRWVKNISVDSLLLSSPKPIIHFITPLKVSKIVSSSII
jgi:hypothetical protein